ncbi:MAG: ATP-binding protein [Dehalococcoidia bacterium]
MPSRSQVRSSPFGGASTGVGLLGTVGARAGGSVGAPLSQLVNSPNFLLATRDSGYRTTSLSIAELIDNSLQAGATMIGVVVKLTERERHPIEILVTDDGIGMDVDSLSACLSFGGSTRFGDRSSLGRYGMGLPNGALSCARRVEVYSWRNRSVHRAHFDLDEFLERPSHHLPEVEEVEPPAFLPDTERGTAVRLQRCDRVPVKRPSTLAARLQQDLGRIYRRFLWDGVEIQVNGTVVRPSDPLLLATDGPEPMARPFGDPLVYRLTTDAGEGRVEVRFTELALENLHSLSVEEKKKLGITGAPCVSVLRANREIDRGWYFMGAKRRENYDDWWRCEVSFEPCLDELFGITHSKQGISASASLSTLLAADLEPIARALNGRVRRRFEFAKSAGALRAAERQAARADPSLPALPRRRDAIPPGAKEILTGNGEPGPYAIHVAEMPVTAPYDIFQSGSHLVLLLNGKHPLYRDLLAPYVNSEAANDQARGKDLALAILAAARAEASVRRSSDRTALRTFRDAWGDVLATFLRA